MPKVGRLEHLAGAAKVEELVELLTESGATSIPEQVLQMLAIGVAAQESKPKTERDLTEEDLFELLDLTAASEELMDQLSLFRLRIYPDETSINGMGTHLNTGDNLTRLSEQSRFDPTNISETIIRMPSIIEMWRGQNGASVEEKVTISGVIFQIRAKFNHRGELVVVGMHTADYHHFDDLRMAVREVDHDLRSPIASMKLQLTMMANILEAAPLELASKIAKRIGIIQSDLEHLMALQSDLYWLATRDSKRGKESWHDVDLNDMLCRLSDEFIAVAENKGLSFDCLGNESMIVTGIAGDLERCFSNLISNSIKYTDRGRVTVALDRAGDYALVTIADTGIGISKEDLPRLFNRFFRAGTATKSGIEGKGLGLAIAHQVIKDHGGRIEVTSEEGRGTVFRVFLPLITSVSSDAD